MAGVVVDPRVWTVAGGNWWPKKGWFCQKTQSTCGGVNLPGILHNQGSTTKRVSAHFFLVVSMRICYNMASQILSLLIGPVWNWNIDQARLLWYDNGNLLLIEPVWNWIYIIKRGTIVSHFCSDWHMPPGEMPISCGFTKINLISARSCKPAWNKRLQKTAKV